MGPEGITIVSSITSPTTSRRGRSPTCGPRRGDVAGDAHKLAAVMGNARAVDIPGRDHNRAVGDKVYKEGVLEFLGPRS